MFETLLLQKTFNVLIFILHSGIFICFFLIIPRNDYKI